MLRRYFATYFVLLSALVSMLTPVWAWGVEGFVPVEGGRVWYQVVGDGPGTPLLLLHGGPGGTSHYLEALAVLGEERPVVFYDQLGCGRSDRPDDASLWRIDRFVAELAQVRRALGLDNVHIYGHSWGATLAMEYLQTNPEGVESVVFASPMLSASLWVADTRGLVAELPVEARTALENEETDSEAYQAAVDAFNARHLSRLDPPPEALTRSLEQFGVGVYETMWGPNEFTVTGSLETYERVSDLSNLMLPVLYTAGAFDEARPKTVTAFASRTPNAKTAIFENASHMTMLERPDAYVRVLRSFLAGVDDRRAQASAPQ